MPCGPILSIAEMWHDPQVEHLALAQTISHPETESGTVTLVGQPVTFADDPTNRGVRVAAAPKGAHTDAILRELGYSDDTITELRSSGAC